MSNGNKTTLRPVPRGVGIPAMAHEPPTLSVDGAMSSRAAPTQVNGLDLLDGATALGLWVLLERPEPNDEMSPGGIILPEARREKPAWIVRAIGEKVTIPLKIGQHVAFDGTRVISDGKRSFAYAMEGQIMGVLNPEALRNRVITQTAGV